MVDRNGEVLYVGKAKSIRKRILSYARPTVYDTRIERMVAATAALEFVSTATETEARECATEPVVVVPSLLSTKIG